MSDSTSISIRQPFLQSLISAEPEHLSIEEQIIEGCIAGNRKAQKLLFDKYAPSMLGLCMRYCRSTEEAEDVMQEAFVKVFTHIESFRKQGSFEGWIKRIMVNHALNQYHKNRKEYHQNIEDINENRILDQQELPTKVPYTQMEMLQAIRELPEGYGIVFNLYVFENYKHREIAEMLDISANTSKSQLSKARVFLQRNLVKIANSRR